jgi:endogenous inhibitor of DNA gyrase (YacG/DUF329 family)
MSNIVCPICDGSFEAALSVTLPFCSNRCRTIDLGRRFEEDYSLPIEGESDGVDEPEME